MTTKYTQLFHEIANTGELLAEQVMDKNHQNNDEHAEHVAQIMRDDFRTLKDKIDSSETLSKQDYTRLMAGALIVANNIGDRIKMYQVALQGYKTDLLPKLQRILDETKTDEEANHLAEEIFQEKNET